MCFSTHALEPLSKSSFGYLTLYTHIRDFDEELVLVEDRMIDDTTIVFSILASTLLIVGICLLVRIKKNFPELHKGYRCYLWSALIALTIPLTLRSIIDALCKHYWPDDNFKIALYNDIFSLLTDFLPVVCQVASLIFGFVRNKQVKFQ